MDIQRVKDLRKHYHNALFDDCLPFWDSAVDLEHGGIFSCLDREGNVYATDKAVWIQGRAMWLYSTLCATYGVREEWLNKARLLKKFIEEHCIDTDGRMFFAVTREGLPLRKRRYFASECFAIIAFAQYAAVTGDTLCLEQAREMYRMVMGILHDPSSDPNKVTPKYWGNTRPMKSLGMPMIMLNVTSVLRECDPDNAAQYDQNCDALIAEVFSDFYKPDEHALLENVGIDGARIDSVQGRLVNPGHSIEAVWFILEEGRRRGGKQVVDTALRILEQSLDIGWDKQYGGIMYFMDVEGKPCEQLEWDMKLWWPHNEALYATLLAYDITGDVKFERWYDRLHDYSFKVFPDRKHGEWYGYAHRDGSISSTLKGNMFKGPFHLPRCLLLCDALLGRMKRGD